MEVHWLVIMILITVTLVTLFSWALVRRYQDRRDSSKLITITATCALTVSLLCLFLIPMDIYTISSAVHDDGSQVDLDKVEDASKGIKTIYSILYIALLTFSFIFLPFAYFWFEEERDDGNNRARVMSAVKYTFGFVLVFVVLLTIGLVLKNDNKHKDADEGWVRDLGSNFSAGEAVLSFSLGCLAMLGLFSWCIYTAYGIINFPLSIMRDHKEPGGEDERGALSSVAVKEDDADRLVLRRNAEKMKYISSRYDLPSNQWRKKDLLEYNRLERENKSLQMQQDRRRQQRHAAYAEGDRELTCCQKIWNCCAPLRLIIGVALLLVSLLVVVSLVLSVIDRFKHSTCKASCGWSIEKSELVNPLDVFLSIVSRVFPIDYLFYGGLIVYIFLCTINGLANLGVRLFCWNLYSMRPGRTQPHALLLGVWLLTFLVIALNLLVTTLSARYTTFGELSYWTDENGDLLIGTTTGGTKHDCNLELSSDSLAQTYGICMTTQVAQFINKMNVKFPFFGVILFFGNLIFFLFFFVFALWNLICRANKAPQDDYNRLERGEPLW